MKNSVLYKYSFIIICLIAFVFGCTNDKLPMVSPLDSELENAISLYSQSGDLSHFILPEDGDYASLPQEPLNPITQEKVALGKLLFFETGLGFTAMKEEGKFTYSCASCHIPTAGFRPGAVQGIADGGIQFGLNGEARAKHPAYEPWELDVQGIRPLSVLNVAYVENTLWNGQFGGGGVNEGTEDLWDNEPATEINHLGLAALESQNIEGLDLHRMLITKEVLDQYGYTVLFDAAFSDVETTERYTSRYASFAISAYLRALITNRAPFQKWLKGQRDAMSDSEKMGALTFFGKGKCATCHTGKGFSNTAFYALGVKDLYKQGGLNTDINDKKNLGRGGFTKLEEDMFKFKVPQLYNLKNAPFYFHGSSKLTLMEVIDYFNEGVAENPNVPESQLASNFTQLYLTEKEKEDLKAFLEHSLYDAELDRYVPDEILSDYCFPNNDEDSRREIGCE